jgi:hypothetical protein
MLVNKFDLYNIVLKVNYYVHNSPSSTLCDPAESSLHTLRPY